MEYGMAAEPSALGAKIKFWQDNTPSEYHTLFHIEDIEKFPEYEVENDAFMAMTLHRIRMQRQRILDTGEILPLVTSRGPMCTAGFVRSTTDFMIDLVEKPEWAHKLLDLCTNLIIDWLKAQQKAMGGTVEGIFILDDIVGFVNEEHYMEFANSEVLGKLEKRVAGSAVRPIRLDIPRICCETIPVVGPIPPVSGESPT
jgi:uroporphyrinogen decarboxylase